MKKRTGSWGKAPWTVDFRAKARELPGAVDVAIVGGGFTGLSAAATLKRLAPAKSVLLLEAQRVGNGASGRTGGMALAETAAGNLRGLGDVLQGYRETLRELEIEADLTLPGVWELARGTRTMDGKKVRAMRRSPVNWNDSGKLRAVRKVPGGSVDPGKVVAGLARAAERAGAHIAELAEVTGVEFGQPLKLRILRRRGRARKRKTVFAKRVLIATNAGSVDLAGGLLAGQQPAEPKLTFALATERLSRKQSKAIGLNSGRPFYTVDLPYLWAKQRRIDGWLWGAGWFLAGENRCGRSHATTRRRSSTKESCGRALKTWMSGEERRLNVSRVCKGEYGPCIRPWEKSV